MGKFPVSENKEVALFARMLKLGIKDDELEESFIRSGGKGGQNVNKVATCVVLRHPASGLEVKCQRARTQGMNRYHARALLADKMDALINGAKSREQQKIEKLKRQKRKRSKRAKEKMLADKHHKSAVKSTRAKVQARTDDE